MTNFPPPSNVRVIEEPRWPELGKLPSEVLRREDIEIMPVEAPPRTEAPHEADKMKAESLARAYEEGQKALIHYTNMVKWFSVSESHLDALYDTLAGIEKSLDTVAFRQSVL